MDNLPEVARLYRLWIPLAILTISAVLGYLSNIFKVLGRHDLSADFFAFINGESGLIEIATVVILAFALFCGARALAPARTTDAMLSGWIIVNLLGAFYFLGEEISWGQHLFDWQTGEWFAAHNDQNETNLHNMSSWLDQKPRLLLFVWCVGGGLLLPLWYRLRQQTRPTTGWPYWFWPTRAVLFVSAVIALIRVPDKVLELLQVEISNPIRLYFQSFNATEMQEFMYACFILIYLNSLRLRLQHR